MMVKNCVSSSKERQSADLVILPVWMDKKGALLATSEKEFEPLVKFVFEQKDFSGKEKEMQLLYRQNGKEPRVLLLGIGEEESCTPEILRSAYASSMKLLSSKSLKSMNVLFPEVGHLDSEALYTAVIEGILMAGYSFTQFKEKPEVSSLAKICFCGNVKASLLQRIEIIIESVSLVRDLVNGNADDVNVDAFKQLARDFEKEISSIKVTILDKKALEKEKMGLILAVGKASTLPPSVIILEYKGDPKSKEKTAIVGKGITYDTGGLNIKVGVGMETMKCDMAGAAAVMGIMRAAAKLKLKVNLVGALAIAENAIGANSYKPGDVFRSRTGKTVEITNTDAEGRLVLADTISYVEDHYQPTRLIDFATLTGGVIVALGEEASGLCSNDDKLAHALEKAGERTHERVWRLPLYPEYKEYLKSPIADIKNSGPRKASCSSGATFIHAFVKSSSWAHLDIAGTAYLSELKACHPTAATGVGVRLFIDFLEHLT